MKPKHIAIIMDGNGRWAQSRVLPRVAGHRRGVDAARTVVQRCIDLKIPVLTLFAFSSENWRRPPAEVKLLMSLLHNLLVHEIHELHANNVKLRVIGEVEGLVESLCKAIDQAHTLTAENTGLQLNIALNYGGRWDIVQAARALCTDVLSGAVNLHMVDEEMFGKYINLSDLPTLDLLIRTSGEQRISNFLLWQMAYSEIYFTPILWPDFSIYDLEQALEFFAKRQRRFGVVIDEYKRVENV